MKASRQWRISVRGSLPNTPLPRPVPGWTIVTAKQLSRALHRIDIESSAVAGSVEHGMPCRHSGATHVTRPTTMPAEGAFSISPPSIAAPFSESNHSRRRRVAAGYRRPRRPALPHHPRRVPAREPVPVDGQSARRLPRLRARPHRSAVRWWRRCRGEYAMANGRRSEGEGPGRGEAVPLSQTSSAGRGIAATTRGIPCSIFRY